MNQGCMEQHTTASWLVYLLVSGKADANRPQSLRPRSQIKGADGILL